jgi:hypothetical protein
VGLGLERSRVWLMGWLLGPNIDTYRLFFILMRVVGIPAGKHCNPSAARGRILLPIPAPAGGFCCPYPRPSGRYPRIPAPAGKTAIPSDSGGLLVACCVRRSPAHLKSTAAMFFSWYSRGPIRSCCAQGYVEM